MTQLHGTYCSTACAVCVVRVCCASVPAATRKLVKKIAIIACLPARDTFPKCYHITKSLCRIVLGKCTRTTMSYYHCFMYVVSASNPRMIIRVYFNCLLLSWAE